MINLSYTLSPTLKQDIERIEKIRNATLLELIPPKKEIAMRLEALAHKTSSALFLSGKSIMPEEIISIIEKDKKSPIGNLIAEFKNAHDHIRHNWTLAEDAISDEDITDIFDIYKGVKRPKKEELKPIVDFITISQEHGAVQSGLAFILFHQLLPKDNNNIKLSSNIAEIFLAKHGLDLRGHLNLYDYWTRDLKTITKILKSNIDAKNVSQFLEYYIAAVSIQAEAALHSIRNKKHSIIDASDQYDLNHRQKKILALFDIPGAKITNRDVQKEFKVSQITASRDLSKLASLGYIFSAGRGRSVFYTKM